MRLAVRSLAAVMLVASAAHAQTSNPNTNRAATGTPNAGVPGTTPGAGLPVVAGGRDSLTARGRQVDTALVAQLDTVNSAAKAGLTNLPPAAAAALVGSIHDKLAASRSPALRNIADDLAALQTELGAGTVNGARIGAILSRVGPKVTNVARAQSGPVAATLREIGSELTAAGRQLVGGGGQ